MPLSARHPASPLWLSALFLTLAGCSAQDSLSVVTPPDSPSPGSPVVVAPEPLLPKSACEQAYADLQGRAMPAGVTAAVPVERVLSGSTQHC